MILLVGLYFDASAERLREFLTCIGRNAANPEIAAVHVMVEEEADPAHLVSSHLELASPKVRLLVTGRRVTFQQLFEYANRELPGLRVIIANTDIFFDRTLARLRDYDLTGRLLCLSRWETGEDRTWRLFYYDRSQDAWIFQSPVEAFPCDFHLGVIACENRLAWEAANAGLLISNPCRSVRAYHLHASGIRRYTADSCLSGPTRYVEPVHLEDAGIPRQSNPPRPDVPCAAVAFRETMGYTVDRLRLGASSHNNDVRPFTSLPEPLAGRRFTQVVAGVVSPLEVEFLSSGRVYVPGRHRLGRLLRRDGPGSDVSASRKRCLWWRRAIAPRSKCTHCSVSAAITL